MNRFIKIFTIGVLVLFAGVSMSYAQGASYSAGPSAAVASGAANGGFAWADVNGDGTLDLFAPSNNFLKNNIASFAQDASATANVTFDANTCGLALADFNGDGVADLFTTNSGKPATGMYYYSGGVFTAATGTGDLATAPNYGQLFMGVGIGPIDHSNYLSIVYAHNDPGTYSDGLVLPPGLGMIFLKGGASGFTNIGANATAGNVAIDTSKSFEAWDPRFFDANNDGWMDLMMPSFRHGYLNSNSGSANAGARKGCIQFVNDGTGKFVIPTGASLSRTIYSVDSIKGGVSYASVAVDTGIIVDDTVRHFNAIGCQFGDLNNDGNQDLILTGTEANNWDGLGGLKNTAVIYGKGDGTYTYHWSGVTTVVNGLNNAGNTRAWGIGDYNNDGWPDVYISATFGSQFLFKNNGNGTFTDVTSESAVTGGGQRAGTFVDYNNDGFLDIYQYTGGNSVLQKNNGNANNWIGFIPVGTGNNKMAIGARFTIWSGATKQIRDIRASGGASGDAGVRALFGLGTGAMDSMMVQWPDGNTQKWTATQLSASGGTTIAKKYWTIQEGATIPDAGVTKRPSWAANDTSLTPYDTLTWHTATNVGTGAVKYQVQVANNIGFNPVLKDVSNLTDTSTIVRLGLSVKYYWRVRSFSAGYTGVWSPVDSFRTKIVACTTVPTKLSPANGVLTVPAKPTLKVSYVAEASTYHIQVRGDSANGFTNTSGFTLNDSVNVLDTAYTFATGLTPGKTYWWRVRGWNAAGNSNWSGVDSFRIMYLPTAPATAFPANNQADVSPANLTFKWRKVAGDSNYVLQYWTFNSQGQVLVSDTTSHDTSFTAPTLSARQRYFWKVMSFNQGGSGPFGAVDSFTTSIEPPGAPVLRSPKSTTGEPKNPTFTWDPVQYAQSYRLQVAKSNNFNDTNLVINRTTTDTVVHVAYEAQLLATTTYFWRVIAHNAGGDGNPSGASFFTTGTTAVTDVESSENEIPKEFALFQNYPNPFNPTTTINYDLPKDANVQVYIYDMLGRMVEKLVDGYRPASRQSVVWNASRLSSGVYIYRIVARSVDGSSDFTSVKKLLLMK